jgi:hypothetical protein
MSVANFTFIFLSLLLCFTKFSNGYFSKPYQTTQNRKVVRIPTHKIIRYSFSSNQLQSYKNENDDFIDVDFEDEKPDMLQKTTKSKPNKKSFLESDEVVDRINKFIFNSDNQKHFENSYDR